MRFVDDFMNKIVESIVRDILAEPVQLKFKKLIADAKAPFKKNQSDSCYDVFAASMSVEQNYIEYGTGIALEIPEGYEVKVFPRSSVSNTGLVLANSVGVIDETYRSELMIRFKAISPYPGPRYALGERIAQIQLVKRVPTDLVEVESIDATGRGGFGSTGK